MKMKLNHENARILAIAPSTRGFGFAVIEREEVLVDWGVKSVKNDKNAGTLFKVQDLVAQYRPEMLVLENTSVKGSRRSARIKKLINRIATLSSNSNLEVALISRQEVMNHFFEGGKGTKQGIAEILAKKFSEELGFLLPPKRKPWMSEDHQMDVFDAVALALVARQSLYPKDLLESSFSA